MTPEEARTLLDRLKHAGNVDDPVYAEVDEAIITMLETIAGMTYEYGVQIDYPTGARLYVRPGICTKYPDRAWWTSKPSGAHAVAVKTREKNTHPVRLVRRLVSQPEEVQP